MLLYAQNIALHSWRLFVSILSFKQIAIWILTQAQYYL